MERLNKGSKSMLPKARILEGLNKGAQISLLSNFKFVVRSQH